MTALKRVKIKIGDVVSTTRGCRTRGPSYCVGIYIGKATWAGEPCAKVKKEDGRTVLVLEKNLLLLDQY
jgi:hypothetical protein